ncbi:unnamed protein product [Protopolystoma xenopodis]|uniref:Uncharacterized protein n=1 Tax=Protopolystoma xenopodis TaxID=117903 RepID=A0A3S5CU17_9PLAT|nr:unnamed protein product [Protopolystoma xenopodis]
MGGLALSMDNTQGSSEACGGTFKWNFDTIRHGSSNISLTNAHSSVVGASVKSSNSSSTSRGPLISNISSDNACAPHESTDGDTTDRESCSSSIELTTGIIAAPKSPPKPASPELPLRATSHSSQILFLSVNLESSSFPCRNSPISLILPFALVTTHFIALAFHLTASLQSSSALSDHELIVAVTQPSAISFASTSTPHQTSSSHQQSSPSVKALRRPTSMTAIQMAASPAVIVSSFSSSSTGTSGTPGNSGSPLLQSKMHSINGPQDVNSYQQLPQSQQQQQKCESSIHGRILENYIF